MKASIIRIGNSRGIRIPKPVLDQCRFEDEVEMEVRRNALVIRAARRPREGWSTAFKYMAQHGDDELIDRIAEPGPTWDTEEWEW